MKPQLELKHKHNLDVCLKNVSRIIGNPDAFTTAEKLTAIESIINQRSLLVFVDTFEEPEGELIGTFHHDFENNKSTYTPALQEAQENNHAGSAEQDLELDVQGYNLKQG